jgi:hypothetical protein
VKNHILKYKERVITYLMTVGRVVLIVTSVFFGFTGGEVYRAYTKGLEVSRMPTVQKVDRTSIAINDRGELMIIDRETGKYLLFDDSVGQSIFRQYASRIYVKNQER